MSVQWSAEGKQEFRYKQDRIHVGQYEVQGKYRKPTISAYRTQLVHHWKRYKPLERASIT